VTTYDAADIRNWSGTGYYIAKSLMEQSLSVEFIGPLSEYRSLLFKAKQFAYLMLTKKRYRREREPSILKAYSQQVSERLENTDADIVFSPGTIPISYLECRQPIVFWTDSTFAGLLDFYPEFSDLSEESVQNGNLMEQSALSRSKLAIYSSPWAAKSAVDNYQVENSKVAVVPYGANVADDRTIEDIRRLVDSRPSGSCRLLFVGVEWRRKGGDTAFRVARELNDRGLKTQLTVVGCKPLLRKPLPSFLRVFEFIDKSTPAGRKWLNKLIAESHFLVLPTKADCTPIVLNEANSFGVPCLASDVGGVPSIIKDDANGRVFAEAAEIPEYCDYVLDLMSDRSRYRQIAISSFNEYQARLNWSVAGKTVKKLLDKHCA